MPTQDIVSVNKNRRDGFKEQHVQELAAQGVAVPNDPDWNSISKAWQNQRVPGRTRLSPAKYGTVFGVGLLGLAAGHFLGPIPEVAGLMTAAVTAGFWQRQKQELLPTPCTRTRLLFDAEHICRGRPDIGDPQIVTNVQLPCELAKIAEFLYGMYRFTANVTTREQGIPYIEQVELWYGKLATSAHSHGASLNCRDRQSIEWTSPKDYLSWELTSTSSGSRCNLHFVWLQFISWLFTDLEHGICNQLTKDDQKLNLREFMELLNEGDINAASWEAIQAAGLKAYRSLREEKTGLPVRVPTSLRPTHYQPERIKALKVADLVQAILTICKTHVALQYFHEYERASTVAIECASNALQNDQYSSIEQYTQQALTAADQLKKFMANDHKLYPTTTAARWAHQHAKKAARYTAAGNLDQAQAELRLIVEPQSKVLNIGRGLCVVVGPQIQDQTYCHVGSYAADELLKNIMRVAHDSFGIEYSTQAQELLELVEAC